MKHLKFLSVLLFTSMLLLLSSCGNDKNNDAIHSNAAMLQGETWHFQKAIVNFMGQTMEMNLNQIRQMYASEMGTGNIMFIDEHIKFEGEYMIMVNTGDRYAYKYYSNGKLWVEGIDDTQALEGVTVEMKIKSLTQNQLVITYSVKMQGISIDEDCYYTR